MRVLLFVVALFLSACATTPTVRTDFDVTANFPAYRTYSWIPGEVPRGMNPLMFARVHASIDRALKARGYQEANPADFAIAFTVGEKDRPEVTDWGWTGSHWGWGSWGWGGHWGGWGPSYPMIDVHTVTDRSIIIDIYDGATRRPVWHGTVTGTSYLNSEVDYSKLDATVDSVLNEFPPRPQPPKS